MLILYSLNSLLQTLLKDLRVHLTFLEDIKMYQIKSTVLVGTAIFYRYRVEELDIDITTANETVIFDGRGVSGKRE